MYNWYTKRIEEIKEVYGDLKYIGPETFEPYKWTTTAIINARSSDGYKCEIQESWAPATFYRLIAHPHGEQKEGWILSTGSGSEVGRMLVEVSKEVACGMIGWHPYSDKDKS